MGISKIGIELEGIWSINNRDRILNEGILVTWKGDTSVNLLLEDTTKETYEKSYLQENGVVLYSNGMLKNLISPWKHQGELTSRPINPAEGIITKWVKTAYPLLVNQTCGMHLHISFTRLSMYYKTVSQKYFDEVYAHLEGWGREHQIKNAEFWNRLKGQNKYCKKQFIPDKQVWSKEKPDSRYCGINYCYSRYKTIELRLLPMFKSPDIAALAINDFIAFTNSFLTQQKLKIVHEEIEEKLPEQKREILQIKKLIESLSNTESIPSVTLTSGSSRTVGEREALRQQVLETLGQSQR